MGSESSQLSEEENKHNFKYYDDCIFCNRQLEDKTLKLDQRERSLDMREQRLLNMQQSIIDRETNAGRDYRGDNICICGNDCNGVIFNDGGNHPCDNCGFAFHWCPTNPPTFTSKGPGPVFCKTCKEVEKKTR